MKTIGIIVVGIVGLGFLTVIGWGLRIVFLPGRIVDRSIGTVEKVVDKTLTADNAIYNYEWFKRQVEAIRAIEKKIVIAQEAEVSFVESAGTRSDWTFEDKTEAARLASIKQGLQSQYQDVVAEYNARANMATRNIFQDGVIPSVIEIGASFLN